MRARLQSQRSTLLLGVLSLTLAVGWSLREAEHACAAGKPLENKTVNLAEVAINNAEHEGKATGKAAGALNWLGSGEVLVRDVLDLGQVRIELL